MSMGNRGKKQKKEEKEIKFPNKRTVYSSTLPLN